MHALRCLDEARGLLALVRQLALPATPKSHVSTRSHAAGRRSAKTMSEEDALLRREREREAVSKTSAPAASLTARRHNFERDASGSAFVYEPHLLLYEFTHGLLLREAQVALLHKCLEAHADGRSLCHQLIMVKRPSSRPSLPR